MASKRTITLTLTEPQCFWLSILIESVLNGGERHKQTQSYEAVLRKLNAIKRAEAQHGE